MRIPDVGYYSQMITYDYIICELCGKKFRSVSSHIRFAHEYDVWEYKKEFGYDKNQPLECGELQQKRHDAIMSNGTYRNITKKRKKHLFKKNRKVEKREISRQTYERIVAQCYEIAKDSDIQAKRSKTLKKLAKIHNPVVNFTKGKKKYGER